MSFRITLKCIKCTVDTPLVTKKPTPDSKYEYFQSITTHHSGEGCAGTVFHLSAVYCEYIHVHVCRDILWGFFKAAKPSVRVSNDAIETLATPQFL